MNVNFHYDKLNSFGKLTSAAGNFPNIINLGEASIERMTVDLKLPEATFTGSCTLTVQGADTEGGTYSTICASGSVTAAMINDGYGLPVPKTNFKFIRVAIAGTYTGTVEAIVNSTLGK